MTGPPTPAEQGGRRAPRTSSQLVLFIRRVPMRGKLAERAPGPKGQPLGGGPNAAAAGRGREACLAVPFPKVLRESYQALVRFGLQARRIGGPSGAEEVAQTAKNLPPRIPKTGGEDRER